MIPGKADYRLLAELFRPRDDAALARECRRLAAQGLLPRDIAAALKVEPAQVARWVREDRDE
jgi:hypothetical protein